jgi:uncharacterized protein YdeI (YjbR/CyaY-like superfamily)
MCGQDRQQAVVCRWSPAARSDEFAVVALDRAGLQERFAALTYSKRKEFARQVNDAKGDDTRQRRIDKVLQAIS